MQIHQTQRAYLDFRFDFLRVVEGDVPHAYVDSSVSTQPPIGVGHIGIGINLQVHGALVMQALGFDIQGIRLTGAALAAEQGYIDQILGINGLINRNYAANSNRNNQLFADLNTILFNRARNAVYQNPANYTSEAARLAFISSPSFTSRTFELTSVDERRRLFELLMDGYYKPRADGELERFDGYEALFDQWLDRSGVGARHPDLRVHNNNERIALISLTFNSKVFGADLENTSWNDIRLPKLLGPKLAHALLNDDRAEAWYEIRYNSGDSPARRFLEADTFGLYDIIAVDNDKDAKGAYRTYTRHRATMDAYENNPSRQTGINFAISRGTHLGITVQRLSANLAPARNYLTAQYRMGVDINGDILVGEDDGSTSGINTRYYRGTDADVLIGSDNNDLIFGESGNDLLKGGRSNDVLYGGSGNDIYIIDAGDGQDIISDKQGNNTLIFDGVPLKLFVRNPEESEYVTADRRFTATENGTDLSITDSQSSASVVIKDFAWGDFGLRKWDIPPTPTVFFTTRHGVPGNFDYTLFTYTAPTPANNLFLNAFEGTDEVLISGQANNHIILGPATMPQGLSESDNDIASGSSGNEVIEGGAGSDRIEGWNGDDKIYAGHQVDLATLFQDGALTPERNWLSGGGGLDLVVGDGGLDVLTGGGGKDLLLAGSGNDLLMGDSYAHPRTFNWSYSFDPVTAAFPTFTDVDLFSLQTEPGNDDVLYGGSGRDLMFGEQGSDFLDGGPGNDYLAGDWINSPKEEHGNDVLIGGSGDDWILGLGGDDILLGGDDDDVLSGDAANLNAALHGNDYLDGGKGRDVLYGEGGNDILAGGRDDGDWLEGGPGDDIYILERGDGWDTINETSGTDTLFLGRGILQQNVQIQRVGSDLDVIVDEAANDAITVAGWFGGGGKQIEYIVFAEGGLWDVAEIRRRANPVINQAGVFSDVEGTPTTYIARMSPGMGDGFTVTIDDAGGEDELKFQNVLLREDIFGTAYVVPTLIGGRREGNDLVLGIRVESAVMGVVSVEGEVRILNHFTTGHIETITGLSASAVATGLSEVAAAEVPGDYIRHLSSGSQYVPYNPTVGYFYVENFMRVGGNENDVMTPFDDVPMVYYGRGGNDVMTGTPRDDVFNGGAGNDTMYGGRGYDSYFIDPNDADFVFDDGVGEFYSRDTLHLPSGVSPANVSFARAGNDLLIGQTRISRYFERDLSASNAAAEYPYMIEFLAGSGFVIDLPQHLINLGLFGTFIGTAGNDTLDGDSFNNTIFGLGGDDFIRGHHGADFLYGGDGNDRLYGRSEILTFFSDRGDRLDGGAGDDYLRGGDGNDVLLGGTGNDLLEGDFAYSDPILTGLSSPVYGRDTLNGGAGDDILRGEQDGDTYQIERGGGIDEIHETGPNRYVDQIAQLDAELATLPSDGLYTNLEWPFFVLEFPAPPWIPQDLRDAMLAFFDGVPMDSARQTLERLRDGMIEHQTDYLEFGEGISAEAIKVVSGIGLLGIDIGGGEGVVMVDETGGAEFGIERFRFADGRELTLDEILALKSVSASIGQITGSSGDDVLLGSFYHDQLYGGDGSDVLIAGGGGDTLYGDAGDDVVAGGAGWDDLNGGTGADVYLFNRGDASIAEEYVWEEQSVAGEFDTLSFGQGIEVQDVQAHVRFNDYGGGEFDSWLVLKLAGSNDTVVIAWQDAFNAGGNLVFGDYRVERLQLIGSESERVFDLAAAVAAREAELRAAYDVDPANPGYVTLFTPDMLGAYELTGSVGIAGGDAARNYALNSAFSIDPAAGEPLSINGTAADDSLTAGSFGATLSGLGGNDTLGGSPSNDTLLGGAGNDHLIGAGGNDTYIFNLGDGVDTISDTAQPGAENSIAFGPGITPDSLSLGIGSLLIRVGDQGDALHLEGFDPANPYGRRAVEYFKFDDGTVLTYAQLIDCGFDIQGTDGDEIVSGTNAADRIKGLGGNDVIVGGRGDDLLDGGEGDDVYYIRPGDGRNVISDAGGNDRVVFADGISITSLQIARDADNLVVNLGGGDQLTFAGWYAGNRVERFSLASATELVADQIEAMVQDPSSNQAPVLANAISDQIASEDIAFGFTIPVDTFNDPNGDALIYSATLADGSALPTWLNFDPATRSFTGTPTNGDVGSVSLKVTATDQGGLSATNYFSLTVNNTNDAPVLSSAAADQSIDEDAAFYLQLPSNMFQDVDAGDVLTLTATRADGAPLPAWLSFDAAARTFSGTPSNDDVGTLALRVSATDLAGASAYQDFQLTVNNVNDAPVVLNGIADQAADEDAVFSFQVPSNAFADVDVGDVLTYSTRLVGAAPLPAWLNFDPATRQFSGTPTNDDVGSIHVEVTATDQGGLGTTAVFELTVNNTNDAPELLSPPVNATADEDAPFMLQLPADPFTDVDAGDTLTYSSSLTNGSPLPGWLSFNATTKVFSGTPTNDDVGALNVRVTATDQGGLSASADFVLTINNTNDAPALVQAINDQATDEDAVFSFTLPVGTFADVDAGDTLALTATRVDGSALPAWLSFDAATRSFSGTPTNDDVGVVDVLVTATDAAGASISDAFVLTVINVNDTPVLNSPLPDVSAQAYAWTGFSFPANSFSDVDVGDQLQYSAMLANGSALPAWLRFDAQTRSFSGLPDYAAVGTHTIRVTATDTSGATASDVFALNVQGIGQAIVGGSGNDNLNGSQGDDTLVGGAGNDFLKGKHGADVLDGGSGNDTLHGDHGNDTYILRRGDGKDVIHDVEGNGDRLLITEQALEVWFERSGKDLIVHLDDSNDSATIQNWYNAGGKFQTETIVAAAGRTLANTQVDQLIQAMAQFSANNGGITWEQAIDQRPDDVNAILAAYWQ